MELMPKLVFRVVSHFVSTDEYIHLTCNYIPSNSVLQTEYNQKIVIDSLYEETTLGALYRVKYISHPLFELKPGYQVCIDERLQPLPKYVESLPKDESGKVVQIQTDGIVGDFIDSILTDILDEPEIPEIPEIENEPLYLEEDLVPSQFPEWQWDYNN